MQKNNTLIYRRVTGLLLLFIILLKSLPLAYAAAPDDIVSGQRAWFDALDLQAQGYSSGTVPTNITGCATLSSWRSKVNGFNLTQSITDRVTTAPTCTVGSTGMGANYDSAADALSVLGDIWGAAGTSVPTADFYIIASSSDAVNQGFLFISQIRPSSGTNRLSSHFPWENNIYLDPTCCSGTRSVPWTLNLNQLYLTNWVVNSGNRQVYINSATTTIINSTYTGTYSVTAGNYFSLGYGDANNAHRGLISEGIIYNRVLNNAERRIIDNYLSAKWGMDIVADDRYVGDTAANGNYRYHVGGIGSDTGTVSTGTSEGLTLSNVAFLATGRYMLAGLPGLSAGGVMTAYNQATASTISAPQQLKGVSTANLTAGTVWRGNRVWYIDKTDASNSTGNVTLTFDITGKMGISSADYSIGKSMVLLYRSATTGNFSVVAGSQINASNASTISFTLPANVINDGYYTIGNALPQPSVTKLVSATSDPINGTTNPKMIPGAVVQYTIRITNTGNGTVDNNSIVITDPIPVNGTLFTGNVSGGAPYQFTNGSPSSGITCPFTALGNLTDCVDFSNDGGATWTYVPNGSFDSAVRHLRFKTTGAMAANTGTGNPFFEIKFNVQIQ